MRYISEKLERKSKLAFYEQKLLSENRAVYEIIWKNIVQPDRPFVTVWRIRIVWIPNATYTHSEDVIINYFLLQQRLEERASLLRYMYIACLV